MDISLAILNNDGKLYYKEEQIGSIMEQGGLALSDDYSRDDVVELIKELILCFPYLKESNTIQKFIWHMAEKEEEEFENINISVQFDGLVFIDDSNDSGEEEYPCIGVITSNGYLFLEEEFKKPIFIRKIVEFVEESQLNDATDDQFIKFLKMINNGEVVEELGMTQDPAVARTTKAVKPSEESPKETPEEETPVAKVTFDENYNINLVAVSGGLGCIKNQDLGSIDSDGELCLTFEDNAALLKVIMDEVKRLALTEKNVFQKCLEYKTR